MSDSAPDEIELEITSLTNLGAGLGRWGEGAGYVIMVPYALPNERVRVRIWRRHPNYAQGDLIEVLRPSPQRVHPRCPLFGVCGGCQYQMLAYEEQLRWKQTHVS